ncbi:ATP-binding protein [Kamptonema sp. UHCC 0994]|uniref:AAA family ATPase n=1 Tax=Kamptonema sp. UHCC 0994 TaxID=3031329 RepID=UPI0023BA6432|nr:ATP-binding protein [Kamptonema sp. UHCC 0994]MDF0556928.1 AAA family ATPase [Kamptonema sp. UHCC 0994]
MLEKVKLVNFKSHKSTELNLDSSRLHALVGQNSSGKTSVLQAIHYLSMLTNSDFTNVFQNERSPEFLTTIGQDNMSVIGSGFWGDYNRENWEASYKWIKTLKDWSPTVLGKSHRDIKDSSQDIKDIIIMGRPPRLKSLRDAASPITESLRYAVHLKLVASDLTKAAYSDAIEPRLDFDSSLLAPTLDYIRAEAPDKFQALQEMLQRIVPGVKKIGVRRAKVPVNRQRSIEVDGKSIFYEESQEMIGQEVVLDMNTGERIPSHAISEGTMLTLGLLTVLMNPKQPNLVLLDDIEQGLHPKAQRDLMTVFKEIIQANPNLQIIFSTHSPYIVDELTPSQVHVLSNTKSGFTRSKRLDEHPDVEWAKQTLTTGEFWDAEGEDWVVEGEIND